MIPVLLASHENNISTTMAAIKYFMIVSLPKAMSLTRFRMQPQSRRHHRTSAVFGELYHTIEKSNALCSEKNRGRTKSVLRQENVPICVLRIKMI